jgi:uncharacterized membrane protein
MAGYLLVKFVHLLLAATWTGTIVAGDLLLWTFPKEGARLERARTLRRLLVGLEMPLAGIVPLLGLLLTGIRPTWWAQGWLHMKVTAVVFLLLVLFLTSRRNRRLLRVLETDEGADTIGDLQVYRMLRVVGWAALLIIFAAVVFGASSVGDATVAIR